MLVRADVDSLRLAVSYGMTKTNSVQQDSFFLARIVGGPGLWSALFVRRLSVSLIYESQRFSSLKSRPTGQGQKNIGGCGHRINEETSEARYQECFLNGFLSFLRVGRSHLGATDDSGKS